MSSRKLMMITICCYVLIIPHFSTAGETELKLVKKEWPAAAKRLEDRFSQVRGTAQLWNVKPRGSAKKIIAEARFAIDHDMAKVEIVRFTRESPRIRLSESVYFAGKGTAFKLARRASEKSYTIQGIGATQIEHNGYLSVFGQFAVAHNGMLGIPMTDFLNNPAVEIMAAEPVDQAGKSLMKVDCVNNSGEVKTKVTFILDPAASWSVRSCGWQPVNKPNPTISCDITYGPSRGEIPIPQRVDMRRRGGLEQHCEFKEWLFAPTPTSEFTMSHYGLPNLIKTPKASNLIPYWLAGTAALLAVIAIVLLWMASRRSSTVQV